MVGLVFSSSFHWYYMHGSRMYITHIKHNFRTLYQVLKRDMVKLSTSVFFSKCRNTRYGFLEISRRYDSVKRANI